MRRAREEDQDDLTPVIEQAQQRGLPLTQVPESACPSEPYAVARLIAAQNKNNNIFVAQVYILDFQPTDVGFCFFPQTIVQWGQGWQF